MENAAEGCVELDIHLDILEECKQLGVGQKFTLSGFARKHDGGLESGANNRQQITITTKMKDESLCFYLQASSMGDVLQHKVKDNWECQVSAHHPQNQLKMDPVKTFSVEASTRIGSEVDDIPESMAPSYDDTNRVIPERVSNTDVITSGLERSSSDDSGNNRKVDALGSREKAHKCSTCGKCFSRAFHLKSHMRIHTGEKPFSCSVCGKTYTHARSLAVHKHTHSENKPFQCSTCDKAFKESTQLKTHMRTHLVRNYPCAKCCKVFVTNRALERHSKKHCGELCKTCPICGCGFAIHKDLQRHMSIHEGEKAYKCEVCGRSFTQINQLRQHSNIHTGKKPHLCSVCGSRFSAPESLKRHMRIHTGEKPYVCSTCGRAFTTHTGCATHIRLHTGDRPYHCETCSESFITNRSLRAHRKKHSIQSVTSEAVRSQNDVQDETESLDSEVLVCEVIPEVTKHNQIDDGLRK